MTDDQALRQLIVDLIERQVRANGDLELTAPADLGDGQLDLTSLELVRLLVSLEEHLDVELDDAAIMNTHFGTVDDIVALVSGSVGAGRAGRV
jgi:acyl carrier protein